MGRTDRVAPALRQGNASEMKKHLQDIQDSLQKAWSDAVSSLHSVEDEVARRFNQLRQKADVPQSSEEVQRVLADLGRRLQDSSEAMEQKLEESVRTVYSRLRTPLADEVARLRTRAEQLSRRIESQLRRGEQAGGDAGQAAVPPDSTDGDSGT